MTKSGRRSSSKEAKKKKTTTSRSATLQTTATHSTTTTTKPTIKRNSLPMVWNVSKNDDDDDDDDDREREEKEDDDDDADEEDDKFEEAMTTPSSLKHLTPSRPAMIGTNINQEEEAQKKSVALRNRMSKPVVGDLDPRLVPTTISLTRALAQPGKIKSLVDVGGEVYRFRYGSELVIHPEMVKHDIFDNSEEAFSNYPAIIKALLVFGTILCVGAILMSTVGHHFFAFVFNEDWSQLKKDCTGCLSYLKYKGPKPAVNLGDMQQFRTIFACTAAAIFLVTLCRFTIRSILQAFQKQTATAIIIIGYLLAVLGEVLILNIIVDWKSAPFQKVMVNVVWFCFDGTYICFLAAKLAGGKLKMKKIMPVYYFSSMSYCLLYGCCFSTCLVFKRLHYIK